MTGKQSIHLKRLKVQKNIFKISPDKLDEVNDFLEFLLTRQKGKKKNAKSLEGIWEDMDFEKTCKLEDSIRDIRKESSDGVHKRLDQWNI